MVMLDLRNTHIYNSTGNLEYGDISPLLELISPHQPVIFSCKSFSNPKWFKGHMYINDKEGITISRIDHISRLTIKMTGRDDSGVYKCVGSTDNGAHFEAESKLIVAGKDSAKCI